VLENEVQDRGVHGARFAVLVAGLAGVVLSVSACGSGSAGSYRDAVTHWGNRMYKNAPDPACAGPRYPRGDSCSMSTFVGDARSLLRELHGLTVPATLRQGDREIRASLLQIEAAKGLQPLTSAWSSFRTAASHVGVTLKGPGVPCELDPSCRSGSGAHGGGEDRSSDNVDDHPVEGG
jgi:hypothetical protein